MGICNLGQRKVSVVHVNRVNFKENLCKIMSVWLGQTKLSVIYECPY